MQFVYAQPRSVAVALSDIEVPEKNGDGAFFEGQLVWRHSRRRLNVVHFSRQFHEAAFFAANVDACVDFCIASLHFQDLDNFKAF